MLVDEVASVIAIVTGAPVISVDELVRMAAVVPDTSLVIVLFDEIDIQLVLNPRVSLLTLASL